MNKTTEWIQKQSALKVSDCLNLKSTDYLFVVDLDGDILERISNSVSGIVSLSNDVKEISKIRKSDKLRNIRNHPPK